MRALTNLQLAGASVALGLAWLVSLAIVGEAPVALEIVRVLLGAVLAPVLAIVVGVRLVAAPLALTHRVRRALQASATVGVIALALTANSFVVGVDDSEAGRPRGLFASLTSAYILVSVLGFAAAIALVLFLLLRRRLSFRASVAVAAPLGVVAAPLVAVTLLGPGAVIGLSLVVFAYAVLPRLSGVFRLPPATPRTVAVEPLRDRVILLAAISLAVTLVVWCGGFALSIANTGTDAATTSLGLASAVGQLAVLPLLWAFSLVIGFWQPRVERAALRGSAAANAVVVVVVSAMVATYSSEGDGYVLLLLVLSAGVGFWAGSIAWALWQARRPAERIALSVVAAVAATVTYAMLAALTAGIVLALVSGLLAFGGARFLLRKPGAEVEPV
ncbi:hypothetical protein [Conyzicola nivalis]|uniref:hypothetical protein n=1 Tax=Conyzicola nivalis TaxID=1477021 RepID=UPI001E567018|nr:hypothetical protein [Conyzicola nivalis]